jgi:hypothetical protein
MLKLVKYHPLFAYSVGDVFEVNEKDTKTLLEGGYATRISKGQAEEEQLEQMIAEEAEKATDKGAGAALSEAKEKSKPKK